LSKNGQVVLSMVELIEQSQLAVDELIWQPEQQEN